MEQINEDYVSFEVAKLLKEKGFCENTEHKIWYVVKQFSTGVPWNSCTYKVGSITREYNDDCCIPMPTLQMAMKWLRKSHNVMISPYALSLGWYFEIFDLTNRDITGCKPLYKVGIPNKEDILNTYEEACEAGIKYYFENLILLTMEILSDGWREELEELIDNFHSMSGGEDWYRQGVKDAIKVIENHI